MGIAYRADTTTGLTIVLLDGEITEHEYYDCAHRQSNDPDWHATTRSLTDARTVLTPAVDSDRLRAFAAEYAQMRNADEPFRAAIVAGHDTELVGRYSELRTDSQTLTIAFNDLPSACIWLDADLEAVRATIDELRDELRDAATTPATEG